MTFWKCLRNCKPNKALQYLSHSGQMGLDRPLQAQEDTLSNAVPGMSLTLLLRVASPPYLPTAISNLPSTSVPCLLFNHVKVPSNRDSSSNRSVLGSEAFDLPSLCHCARGEDKLTFEKQLQC